MNFSRRIEQDGLKLCQEWVRNTVDPDLVDAPYDKDKLRADIESVRKLIEAGVERGELKGNVPVEALANMLTDVVYGEMLCWDMSGGAYSFEGRTQEFCELFLPALLKPYLSEGDREI